MWKFIDGVTEPAIKKPKTKDQRLETQRDYEKNQRKRDFQSSWLKDYKWLSHDADKQEMYCEVCRQYETVGSFVTGCSNFKVQTIKTHDASEGHKKNFIRHKASDPTTHSDGARSLSLLNTAARDKLRLLFSNAHYVAKMGRPYTDYVQLCTLDRTNKNLEIGNTYVTDRYCQVFVKYIADSIRTHEDKHFENSMFVSVISDGSTDCASKEAECILLRSAAKGKALTQFIGIKYVPKADSEHISQAIVSVLNGRFGESWQSKFVAVGCDGASVMLGQKSGVAQKLRELTGRPHAFAIHCSAHRLELSYKDAAKSLSTKVHQKCEILLLNLYLFYKCSPLNRANLKASFDSLGKKMVVPTRVGGSRWLPHMKRALKHILVGRSAIIQHLEQLQNPCDPSHRKDAAAKGKHFLRLLRSNEVTVWLHFLMDVVSCLSDVSEAVQQQNSTLADVWNELQAARCILTKYLETQSAGAYLRKVESESKGVLEAGRKNFLHSIIDSLHRRFQGDIQLFKGSSFVSFENWPDVTDDDLGDFGDADVANIVEVCRPALESAGCDPESVEGEWIRFKTDVFNSKKTMIRSLKWEALWDTLSSKYSNLSVLISLLLSLPSSSVDAERGFSRMKIQKSDWRSRLTDTNLTDLMLISMEGPEVGKFDPDHAIELWESGGVRSRRPFHNDSVKPKVSVDNEDIGIVSVSDNIPNYEDLTEECGEISSDDDDRDDEDDWSRRDLITLQQKSYRLLLSLDC